MTFGDWKCNFACKAIPHFVDSSADNLGVDTEALEEYLGEVSEMRDGHCWNKKLTAG